MRTRSHGNSMLVAASSALAGAVLFHGIDHSLQERGVGALSTEVFVGGIVNAALAAFVLVLAMRDHPRAPLAAAAIGAYLAIVVLAAHFAPHWSAFSDPYSELGLGFLSWAAAGLEVAAAVVLSAVGFAVMRRRRVASQPAPG